MPRTDAFQVTPLEREVLCQALPWYIKLPNADDRPRAERLLGHVQTRGSRLDLSAEDAKLLVGVLQQHDRYGPDLPPAQSNALWALMARFDKMHEVLSGGIFG